MLLSAVLTASALAFNAGADFRVREEIMQSIPQAHGGQVGEYDNHFRFRPRVWGEVKGDAKSAGKWRIFARLVDEFRWNPKPYKASTSWPGEVIFDNLFIEGKGIDEGFLDLKIGRQDLYNYCGLEHLFVDGTPGDGSRDTYSDMATVRFNLEDESTIDLFGLYNFDSNHDFRWGDETRRWKTMASRFYDPEHEGEQDDFGYGVIWGSKIHEALKYQVFAMQKHMVKAGDTNPHTELVGTKFMPRWDEELSSTFEVMSELNEQWSAYLDIAWKKVDDGIKPFAKLGYHYLSDEWDPMWSRGVNDSEMFLYGTHNGTSWWSNMHYVKLTAGLDFGVHHALTGSTGPMWAARRDDVGGNHGAFKGYLSQLKYEFPLLTANRERGERFEIFGHCLVEMFNPGDYWYTDKTAWFVRWQVEFTF